MNKLNNFCKNLLDNFTPVIVVFFIGLFAVAGIIFVITMATTAFKSIIK